MADHMRRNDKLQALAADASRARFRTTDGAARRAAESAPERGSHARRAGDEMPPQPPKRSRQPSRGNASSLTLVGFFKQNIVGILSVTAVVVLVVLMVVFLRACAPQEGDSPQASSHVDETQASPNAFVSPYDWTKLNWENGRLSYVVDGQVKSRIGIDVSENQHEIDWQAVAADGIDFAIIRLGYRGATEGDLYLDPNYGVNLEGAKNAGLDCGIYFFSQAITVEEAVEEADFVISNLGGAYLEYPVAFDSEVLPAVGVMRTADLSNDEMTAIAEAFCDRLNQAGYSCLVYGNRGDLARYNADLLDRYDLWWAEYGPSSPNADVDIVMWQYDNGGSVSGVSTAVDMNIDLSPVLE